MTPQLYRPEEIPDAIMAAGKPIQLYDGRLYTPSEGQRALAYIRLLEARVAMLEAVK